MTPNYIICEIIAKDIIQSYSKYVASEYVLKLKRPDESCFVKEITRTEWMVLSVGEKYRVLDQ